MTNGRNKRTKTLVTIEFFINYTDLNILIDRVTSKNSLTNCKSSLKNCGCYFKGPLDVLR